MKYWTLFLLRMMVRVALLLAVTGWVAGQFGYRSRGVQLGHRIIAVATDERTAGVTFVPAAWLTLLIPDVNGPPAVQQLMDHGLPRGAVIQSNRGVLDIHGTASTLRVQIEHWLLCLLLLVATIATSVTWKKRARQESPVTANE